MDSRTPLVRRRLAAALGGWIALVGVLLPAAPPAAHTDLVETSPAAGARLTSPPSEVRLVFTDPMSPALSTIMLSVDDAKAQRLEVTSGAQPSTLVAQVPESAVEPGVRPTRWLVTFRVVSQDGHPVDGDVRFRVNGSPEPQSEAPSASSTEGTGTDDAQKPAVRSDASSPADDEGGAAWALWGALLLVVAAAVVAQLWLARRSRRE